MTTAPAPSPVLSGRERVVAAFRAAHDDLVRGFEAADGEGRFKTATWDRPGGGGGTARVLEGGRVFERAGVNMSVVHGERVPPALVQQHPEVEGHGFFATGVSLVLHAQNPYVPAFHANFRYFETTPADAGLVGGAGVSDGGEAGAGAAPVLWWFGGGADLTPSYPFAEDAVHFHSPLQALCQRHEVADYDAWKAVCDEYFRIRHRHEARGVGGIFFDQITPAGGGDFDAELSFVRDGLASLLSSYLPIVERRKATAFGDRERAWQLQRRGRYVEFNLVYDRGTLFGLQTDGNIEAILMSMPPLASWAFDAQPEPGSAEAAALAYFQPRDWVGEERRHVQTQDGDFQHGGRAATQGRSGRPGTAAPATTIGAAEKKGI